MEEVDKRIVGLIHVTFQEHAEGSSGRGYIATSDALEGLFISHYDLNNVINAVPVAIRMLMKAQHGKDVTVRELVKDQKMSPIRSVRAFSVEEKRAA